jgi:hypothetical protein
MKATEARVISETFDNSLKDMLFSIKCMAKCGNITATWCREDKYIGEKELSELQKLGYKVLRNDDRYVTVGW